MTITLRPAAPEDAIHIAELADIAGDGFPSAIWASTAEHGQTAIDVGAERAKRETGVFSYKHATIAECDGKIAGLAISYINGDTPEVISEQTHPMFRPMVMLENEALETRYVSMLSTYPIYRKTGVAHALLDREEQRPGPRGLSLITSDHNIAARKFLEQHGFHEAAVVPAIKINWDTPTKSWHLLRKP
ncbi:Acetyltransferase (GNAT) family protein [Cognatiyoonia koreensis]|uniref:Acetyltransferase (GNAT) family protein n=1 Tax=Cognatiyoonia koreensis TaxID=364200 RepID=A0A1I0P8E4_9RHOB|nr:GNAT family N-acetyltransferase [Cognatiyoonia koreensis]SEW09803.1 Acetyltransferase (GNAT) family protein [Cognatiyoonia koreensis]